MRVDRSCSPAQWARVGERGRSFFSPRHWPPETRKPRPSGGVEESRTVGLIAGPCLFSRRIPLHPAVKTGCRRIDAQSLASPLCACRRGRSRASPSTSPARWVESRGSSRRGRSSRPTSRRCGRTCRRACFWMWGGRELKSAGMAVRACGFRQPNQEPSLRSAQLQHSPRNLYRKRRWSRHTTSRLDSGGVCPASPSTRLERGFGAWPRSESSGRKRLSALPTSGRDRGRFFESHQLILFSRVWDEPHYRATNAVSSDDQDGALDCPVPSVLGRYAGAGVA